MEEIVEDTVAVLETDTLPEARAVALGDVETEDEPEAETVMTADSVTVAVVEALDDVDEVRQAVKEALCVA